jgi:hypothetical protein
MEITGKLGLCMDADMKISPPVTVNAARQMRLQDPIASRERPGEQHGSR